VSDVQGGGEGEGEGKGKMEVVVSSKKGNEVQ
jgi:hypothetical protein